MQLEFALNKEILLVWYEVATGNKIQSEIKNVCLFVVNICKQQQ